MTHIHTTFWNFLGVFFLYIKGKIGYHYYHYMNKREGYLKIVYFRKGGLGNMGRGGEGRG